MEWYNSLLEDTFSHSLGLFADPSARLYGWHLLGALCLAIVYVISKSSKKRVLSLATLWTSLRHPSSFLDVKLFFFNAAFRACFILPWMLGTMLLSTSLYRVLDFCFPFHVGFFLEEETRLWAFTLISFVVADFFSFIHHYLMHTIPFLWRFHKVHHSAEVLTPLTLYRIHPVEMVLATFRNTLSAGLVGGCFMFFFSGRVAGVEILGVNALGLLFNLAGANLRHSSIPFSFGPAEYLCISPAQHQIHHAKGGKRSKFYHKNFGVCLSVWDQILGSFVRGNILREKTSLSYGIEENVPQSLFLQLALPFMAIKRKKGEKDL